MYNRAAAASMIMFVIIMFFSSILFFLLRDEDADGYGTAENKRIKKQAKLAKKAQRKGGVFVMAQSKTLSYADVPKKNRPKSYAANKNWNSHRIVFTCDF